MVMERADWSQWKSGGMDAWGKIFETEPSIGAVGAHELRREMIHELHRRRMTRAPGLEDYHLDQIVNSLFNLALVPSHS
jgi:hypothetical protein